MNKRAIEDAIITTLAVVGFIAYALLLGGYPNL